MPFVPPRPGTLLVALGSPPSAGGWRCTVHAAGTAHRGMLRLARRGEDGVPAQPARVAPPEDGSAEQRGDRARGGGDERDDHDDDEARRFCLGPVAPAVSLLLSILIWRRTTGAAQSLTKNKNMTMI